LIRIRLLLILFNAHRLGALDLQWYLGGVVLLDRARLGYLQHLVLQPQQRRFIGLRIGGGGILLGNEG